MPESHNEPFKQEKFEIDIYPHGQSRRFKKQIELEKADDDSRKKEFKR